MKILKEAVKRTIATLICVGLVLMGGRFILKVLNELFEKSLILFQSCLDTMNPLVDLLLSNKSTIIGGVVIIFIASIISSIVSAIIANKKKKWEMKRKGGKSSK